MTNEKILYILRKLGAEMRAADRSNEATALQQLEEEVDARVTQEKAQFSATRVPELVEPDRGPKAWTDPRQRMWSGSLK